ncbi:unnamed protein product, partial [Rotaria magnacalcarata]
MHPDLATTYNNIGAVYDAMEDQHRALLYYKKALAIQEQILPSDHPDFSATYNNIAIA